MLEIGLDWVIGAQIDAVNILTHQRLSDNQSAEVIDLADQFSQSLSQSDRAVWLINLAFRDVLLRITKGGEIETSDLAETLNLSSESVSDLASICESQQNCDDVKKAYFRLQALTSRIMASEGINEEDLFRLHSPIRLDEFHPEFDRKCSFEITMRRSEVSIVELWDGGLGLIALGRWDGKDVRFLEVINTAPIRSDHDGLLRRLNRRIAKFMDLRLSDGAPAECAAGGDFIFQASISPKG